MRAVEFNIPISVDFFVNLKIIKREKFLQNSLFTVTDPG